MKTDKQKKRQTNRKTPDSQAGKQIEQFLDKHIGEWCDEQVIVR